MQDDLISLFLINYFQFINTLHRVLKECKHVSQKKIIKIKHFQRFSIIFVLLRIYKEVVFLIKLY